MFVELLAVGLFGWIYPIFTELITLFAGAYVLGEELLIFL